jgi:hypothetical protein
MGVAIYVVGYLSQNSDMLFVLSDQDWCLHIDYHVSHPSGPRKHSITGMFAKLNEKSGTIYLKAAAAQSTQKLSRVKLMEILLRLN